VANDLFTARNVNGQDYRVSIIWWPRQGPGRRKWINVARLSLLGEWEVERHIVVAEAAVWRGSLTALAFRPTLIINYEPDRPQRLNEVTFREIVREIAERANLVKLRCPAMKPINKQPRSCNLVKRVQIVIRRRTLTPSLVAHTRLCFLMRHTVVAPPDSPRPRGLRGAKPADGGRGTRSPPAGLPAPAGKIVRAARQPRKLASRSLQVKSSSPAARLRTDARHAQRAVFPLQAYSLPTGFNGLSHD